MQTLKELNKQQIHPEWQNNVSDNSPKVYWFAFLEQVTTDADLLGISYDPRFIKKRNAAEKLIKDNRGDRIDSTDKEISDLHRILTKLAINKDSLNKKYLINMAENLLNDFSVAKLDETIKDEYQSLLAIYQKSSTTEPALSEAINRLTEKLPELRNFNRMIAKASIDHFYNLAKQYQVDDDVGVVNYFRDLYLSLFTAYSPIDFKIIYVKIEGIEKAVSNAVLDNRDDKTVVEYTKFILNQAKKIVFNEDFELCSIAKIALNDAQSEFNKNKNKSTCVQVIQNIRKITLAQV